ncbi:unnamed protein product [Coffea canephora]|uniref:Filament-like plant protein n=1 Tax=Coffea canephora TaxID=49390 RepID=A0A068URM1_COFCA|nr:unnamed protein product [Coffea canephora]
MEKRKWLWKKKPSERSPGETDSSGSSLSERYSDEQQIEPEEVKDSPNDRTQSPEVTSKVVLADEEVTDTVKNLTAKLSSALVNVSVKEDLVKQHAKVAEEAVAGWEKAENEVTVLKQQLEAAVQQNLALEVRASHLDSALKECVRELRQARDEQEARINDAVAQKTSELESVKIELENQLHQLKTNVESTLTRYPASADPNIQLKLESLEKENSILKFELLSRSEELEIRTIERDLSTQAAETASKQQLESIKKVVKLEAECRRLQTVARKSSSSYDHRSTASSVCAESVTDSQPDSGDRVNSIDNTHKKLEPNEWERNHSDSWASALIAELDQFKNEKGLAKDSLASSVEIDMMDDFLEMERLVALPDAQSKFPSLESEPMACKSSAMENSVKPELETMVNRVAELEERLKKIEEEKTELQHALTESEDSLMASRAELHETESRLEDLQKELCVVNEAKELLEFQLIGMEVEARTLSANVDSLKAEVQKERSSSAKMAMEYQELENELIKKSQEIELQQAANSNSELKIKQEDLAVAADKLAECQQTIASLGKQLQSLATLEDFLTDTSNLPGFSGNKAMVPASAAEWKARANDAFVPKYESDPSGTPAYTSSLSTNGIEGESPASSSSSTSSANSTSARNRNGFVRLFSRSKSGIQLENHQG